MISNIDRITEIEAALVLASIDLTASEVHGTLVGAISNHLKSGMTPDLLKLIEPQADQADDNMSQLKDSLQDLYRETSEQLFEGKDTFDILLPADDEPLSNRVHGIATWARGYTLGLLYNNAFSVDQLPESAPEFVRDLMQIADVEMGEGDENDEERSLVELHEYIKVGVQLVFEFIYSERSSETPTTQQ